MKRNTIRLFTLPCALLVSGMALAHSGNHEAAGFTSGFSHPLTACAGMPGVETGIATSVLVTGLLLATQARLPATVSIALVGVFALFHGSAHGAEMPATAAPLLYGLGFLVSTAALHVAGFGLGRLLQHARSAWLLRGAGVVTGGFGAWLLLGA